MAAHGSGVLGTEVAFVLHIATSRGESNKKLHISSRKSSLRSVVNRAGTGGGCGHAGGGLRAGEVLAHADSASSNAGNNGFDTFMALSDGFLGGVGRDAHAGLHLVGLRLCGGDLVGDGLCVGGKVRRELGARIVALTFDMVQADGGPHQQGEPGQRAPVAEQQLVEALGHQHGHVPGGRGHHADTALRARRSFHQV
ncbi:MAG: hypothetical protein DI597_00835 [Pseudoxanthomonas spadix]|nr:MAG: hypothetical protein DI597_00835 [Pseudoxanthomonas spadix]